MQPQSPTPVPPFGAPGTPGATQPGTAGLPVAQVPSPAVQQVGGALPPTQPLPASVQSAAAPVASNATQVADDGDVIEKTWVNKARQLVAQTAQDPAAQAVALNQLKAEYMKQRYGKDVKVSGD